MGVRVDGAAGPLALGAKGSACDRLRLTGGPRAPALGSYIVSLRWRGMAPAAQRGTWHPSGLRPSVPRVVQKGCAPQEKRLTMICASLALLHPLLSLTHWIFRSLMLPYKSSSHSANHVRCVSLRSGGRRLAVRKTIEYQIGALPRTPFPAAREFPSRGNEGYEEKNRGVICFMYYSGISPFGGWRHHLATSSRGHYKPVLTIESHMGRLPRGSLLSTVHILHRMCKSGEVRRLACP